MDRLVLRPSVSGGFRLYKKRVRAMLGRLRRLPRSPRLRRWRGRPTHIDDDTALVRVAYLLLFQREPDAEGLRLHVSRLRSGTTWPEFIAALVRSEEFAQLHTVNDEAYNRALVRAAFRAVLWRDPADEVLEFYAEHLGKGLSLTKVFSAVVHSGEFETLANEDRRRERRAAAIVRDELAIARRLAVLEERVEGLTNKSGV